MAPQVETLQALEAHGQVRAPEETSGSRQRKRAAKGGGRSRGVARRTRREPGHQNTLFWGTGAHNESERSAEVNRAPSGCVNALFRPCGAQVWVRCEGRAAAQAASIIGKISSRAASGSGDSRDRE